MIIRFEDTLKWAEQNKLNIFPIIYKSKKPLVAHKEFQKRMTSKMERKTWFYEEKNNIAVLGGKISDNLLIFDIDNLKFAKKLMKILPKTTIVQTKNGLHYFYKTDQELHSKRLEFKDEEDKIFGIDIHGKGKYAVIPPSIHPSGFQYKFLNLNGIKSVKFENIIEEINILAEKENYINLTQVKEEIKIERKNTDLKFNNGETDDLINLLPPLEVIIGFTENGPHPIHGSEGGSNLSVNVDKQEWYCFRHNSGGSILQWFAMKNFIINCEESSDMTSKQYSQTFEAIRDEYNIKREIIIPSISFQQPFVTEKLNTEENIKKLKYIRWTYHGLREKKSEKWKIKPDRQKSFNSIAVLLTDNFKFKCIMNLDVLYMYHLKEGIWSDRAEVFVRQVVRDIITKVRKEELNEVIDKIKTKPNVYSEDIFNKKHIIVLGNGVYDFNDHQFKPYEYFYYATRKLPWLYNPDSQCQPILEALHSWLDEEDVRIFLELIGYCLYPDYNIHSSFWLTGKGGNGKTTAMNLLVHFLRPENITAMKPQLFIEETVATARLDGKLANIGDDIPSAPLKDGGELKKLTGYSAVEGRVLYKGFFEFYNTAKMIFACQTIPASDDDSDAWYRRAIRLQFSKQFLGKDKDPDYLKKLTNSELMSGLLNLAILNLKNLLKRGDFETDFNLEEKKRNYIMASDPAKAFITYGIILDQDYKIKYEEAYEEFKDFCKVFKLDPVSKNNFTIAINQWGTGIRINKLREKDEITKEKTRFRYLVGCSTKKIILGHWSSKEENIKKSSGPSGTSGTTLPIFNSGLKNSTKSYRLFPKHPTRPPRRTTSKESTKNLEEVNFPEELLPEVEKLISKFDDGEGAERSEIIEKIISSTYDLNGCAVKYTKEQVEDCLFCLTFDGKAYEPRPNYIRMQV